MKFQLHSLDDLHTFQNQILCVELSELSYGFWEPYISSLLFETVHISILQKTEVRTHTFTTMHHLKPSHFMIGASLVQEPPSEKGGVVRFPLRDILRAWIRTLHLPETLAPQDFLESIFQKHFSLHIVLTFAPVHRLYHSDIPLKIPPSVQYSVEDGLPFADLFNARNRPG